MNRIFRILVLLAATLWQTAAMAQIGQLRNDFAVGVNGGVSFNKISFNPTINQTWKQGTQFGVTVRYSCERYLGMLCSLQGEVNYAQLGWKENIEDRNSNPSPDTYERTINYIQIPLLARLAFGREMRGVAGYLILGPQIGFYLNDKVKKNEWESELAPSRPNNVVEQYSTEIQNKFEYGLTGGLGIEVSTAIGHFMAEGRYYFALSNVFKDGKQDPFGRSANGAIVAKVTYLFDLFKTKGVKRK